MIGKEVLDDFVAFEFEVFLEENVVDPAVGLFGSKTDVSVVFVAMFVVFLDGEDAAELGEHLGEWIGVGGVVVLGFDNAEAFGIVVGGQKVKVACRDPRGALFVGFADQFGHTGDLFVKRAVAKAEGVEVRVEEDKRLFLSFDRDLGA